MAKINKEAQQMVIQSYWNKDQDLKLAKTQRDNLHDLALLAVPLGSTAGPAADADGVAHWLTHGEKERVEISTQALWERLVAMPLRMSHGEMLSVLRVDATALRDSFPLVYAMMLKHRSTKRAKHDCLTWSEKQPKARAKGPKR